jgi:hypothetical protein
MNAKGDYLGPCNRTACHHLGAIFFNRSTQKYYCEACAYLINKANGEDCLRLYGNVDLCVEVIANPEEREALEISLSQYKPQ